MSVESFPLSHRLLNSEEFDAVFDQKDYSVSNKSLLVLASKNSLGFNRLGLIVGKKSLPRAVDRNKVKRQLREAFRRLEPMGMDIVVLVRPGIRAKVPAKDNETLGKTIFQTLDNLKKKVVSS